MDFDIKGIKKAIEVLKPDRQLYEIRVLLGNGKKKTTISGFFKGTDNVEAALKRVAVDKGNVFISLQALNEQCYSMEQHERFVQTDTTASDGDITDYEWFLVDLDPKRKSGISSADSELKLAREKALKIKSFLIERGFSEPIEAMSGNGFHLLFKVNFPNNEENELLYKKCLYVIDSLFSDDEVDVDKSVFNPSRVSKLYGSIARKGANTEERPHRLSKILTVPKQISATERTTLVRLASLLPDDQKEDKQKIKKKGSGFDVSEWLSDHNIGVYRTTSTADGATKYILEECPFDNSHKAPDSMVIVQTNGAIGFRCLHNSCINHDWHELRQKFEPDAYDHGEEDDKRLNEGWKIHKQYLITKQSSDPEEIKSSLPQLKPISAKKLQEMEFPETYYAVEGMIPEGETVIAAPPKTGKSWLMLDMCLKVSKGETFLNFPTRKSETLYLALEDGDKFEQERLNIVCPETAPENFHFIFNDVVHLNEGFLLQLDSILDRIPNIKLVVIDTLNFIQFHPGKGESAYNCDYRTGRELKAYAEKRGLAIVVVTHTTKMLHAEDEMANVSGTNGVTGAADAVMILSKKVRTDLDARLFVTGRKVRQSTHDIKFNDEKCIWEYKGVHDPKESDQRELEEKEQNYYASKIREAIVNISLNTEDYWQGGAGQIMEEALKYDIGIKESNKMVGGFVTKMMGMFLECDGIQIERIKNGSGASSYRIYKKREI